MDYFVIGFLVASATLCFIAIYSYRRSRRLEKENHERLMRELDENNARIRQARAERRSKMTSLYTPASTTRVVETRAHQDRYSDRRPVAVDDNSDMLTMMILQNALNSSSDTVSGSVRWDNDTPTITPTPSYTPSYESSSSSSYSSYSSSDSSSSYSDSSSSDSGSSSCD
jgi:hypothetical protein